MPRKAHRFDRSGHSQPVAVHVPQLQPASLDGHFARVHRNDDFLRLVGNNCPMAVEAAHLKAEQLDVRQICRNIQRQIK